MRKNSLRVNSTEVEDEEIDQVRFMDEEYEEVADPKERPMVEFKPQPKSVVFQGVPTPSAWESHPDSWNGNSGVATALHGSWARAP